jgi:SAM-dependent methyltransferase
MKLYTRKELQAMAGDHSDSVQVDLGCGSRKREGYVGVDIAALPGVDIVCTIEEGLPFEDSSVDRIWSNFMFEHIQNTIFLFQELFRVCKKDAVIEFVVPYFQSVTQFKDPTHKAFIMPEMIRYFTTDKWYGSDYGINTNFEIVHVQYHYMQPFKLLYKYIITRIIFYPVIWLSRRYLWNVVHSITITLKVVK